MSRASDAPAVPRKILRQLAKIAKVPIALHPPFFHGVNLAVREAHRLSNVKKLQPHTAAEIVAVLTHVMHAALALRNELLRMQPESREINRDTIAGRFLRSVMLSTNQNETNKMVTDRTQLGFTGHLTNLEILAHQANEAARQARMSMKRKGRPKGTSGKVGFEMFVRLLWITAATTGERLTAYKSAHSDAGWEGSLLQAVDLLRPYLQATAFFQQPK